MVGRATCCCRIDACETEHAQVEFIDEDIDHSHWVFIGDVVVQALRQQCDLRPSLTFDEPLHDCPRHDHDGQKVRQPWAFSHSLGRKLSLPLPDIGRNAHVCRWRCLCITVQGREGQGR
ncbi:hypothetical protein D3C79_804490 [compost metagenome]